MSQRLETSRLSELWGARELLRNLTVRELKVRYKRSALGFFWSLLNPLLMMAVFTVVFTLAFKVQIEDFPFFFLAAYLPWSFFQAAVQVSSGVIVGNSNLVKKIYFPREALPLSVVLSQLVHFGLAMMILFVALVIRGYGFWPYLPAFLLAVVILIAFTTGMSFLFAALNTKLRDIQEFLPVLFLLWFYMTPVIYSLDLIDERYRWVFSINPMTHIVEMMRDSLYRLTYPSAGRMLAAAGFAAFSLILGYGVFGRFAADFAKEV